MTNLGAAENAQAGPFAAARYRAQSGKDNRGDSSRIRPSLSFRGAAALLLAWNDLPDLRVHRPALLQTTQRALATAATDDCSFEQVTIRAREELCMLALRCPAGQSAAFCC